MELPVSGSALRVSQRQKVTKSSKVAPTFALPKAPLARIRQIVQIYGLAESALTGAEAGSRLGIHATEISRNGKFLVGVGLLTAGQKRSATDLGRRLSAALSAEDVREICLCWRAVVEATPFLTERITTLRVRGSMSRAKFLDHIASTSGEPSNSYQKTGTKAVLDLLVDSGLVRDLDDTISAVPESEMESLVQDDPVKDVVPEPREEPPDQDQSTASSSAVDRGNEVTSSPSLGRGIALPPIAINIQLHIPATEDYEIYKNLFRALRTELLEPRTE